MASSFFILAQTQAAAAALELWRNQLSGVTEEKPADNHQVVVWQETLDLDGITKAYAELSSCIEVAAAQASQSARGRLVVMVDQVYPTTLDVCAESGWGALVATLILTFPEVQWVFGCAPALSAPNTEKALSWDSVFSHCSLPSLLKPDDGCPHFDSSGLRAWVRQRTNQGSLKEESLRLGIRSKTCAAIDDEAAFAHFHAYTAYRFGLRAEVITTWKLMERRFGIVEGDNKPHGYWMLLEDMSLNFADRNADVHLHRLGRWPQSDSSEKTREDYLGKLRSILSPYPILDESEHRILITSGQSADGGKDLKNNEKYLKNKSHGFGKKVSKPASGMFDLWSKIGLIREKSSCQKMFFGLMSCLRSCKFNRRVSKLRKNAEFGYVAGFVPFNNGGSSANLGGHGAPGRLGLIASKLVKRAAIINEHVLNVEDALLGAVLATDALELLGCRAPTTAFEALSLKHQLEVIAECQFSGIAYNIELKSRLSEIERNIKSIFDLTELDGKVKVTQNAEMILLTRLVRIFREHGQFDEEQQCMHQVRKLNNLLWTGQLWSPVKQLCRIVLCYVELLLSSFFKFAGFIVFWIILIGIGFMYWGHVSFEVWSQKGFLCGIQESVSSFFSMGPPIRAEVVCGKAAEMTSANAVLYAALSSFTIFLGALHLGIFISYVYSLIARK